MIQDTTPSGCLRQLQEHVTGYFARLQQAAGGAGIQAVPRVPAFETMGPPPGSSAAQRIRLRLGPTGLADARIPMANPTEVEQSLETYKDGGLMVRQPQLQRLLVALGTQALEIHPGGGGRGFFLRTHTYRYVLLIRSSGNRPYALRHESDPGNSWLLNHPKHHIQFGFENDLRLDASTRTLIGFIDWTLRQLVPTLWQRMYPALFGVLDDPRSAFRTAPHGHEANQIAKILKAESASSPRSPWFADWTRWRRDVALESAFVPEFSAAFQE